MQMNKKEGYKRLVSADIVLGLAIITLVVGMILPLFIVSPGGNGTGHSLSKLPKRIVW